jgi:hypothetical protein
MYGAKTLFSRDARRPSMRTLMSLIGLFLVFSGVATLLNPHPLLVGRQMMSRMFFRSTVVVEYVSKGGSITYGACSTALGFALIYGVFLGDIRVERRDRAIAHRILVVSRELVSRYGRIEDCSRRQIESTALELRVDPRLLPYLLAAFLGKEELRKSENQWPETDWKEVVDRVDQIFVDPPHGELLHSHFHPSWAGVDGA